MIDKKDWKKIKKMLKGKVNFIDDDNEMKKTLKRILIIPVMPVIILIWITGWILYCISE